MPAAITLDVILGGAAGPLMAHWLELSRARGGGIPLRSQIDPAAIASLLSCTYICERTGADIRYRLAGAQIEQVLGTSVRGLTLPEIFHDALALDVIGRIYNEVMDGPSLAFGRGQVYVRLDRISFGTRLVLPLSSDGSSVDMLIGVTAREIERKLEIGETTDGRQNSVVIPLRDLAGLNWSGA